MGFLVAVDTNLPVRLVTNDDPRQAERAASAIDSGEGFFVLLRVSLELECVLWVHLQVGHRAGGSSLEGLRSVRRLHFEQDTMPREALHRHRQGLDFTDALDHLAAAICDAILRFDGALLTGVEHLGLEPVVRAP